MFQQNLAQGAKTHELAHMRGLQDSYPSGHAVPHAGEGVCLTEDIQSDRTLLAKNTQHERLTAYNSCCKAARVRG